MVTKEIIEDLCGNCGNYCTLKEIVLNSGLSARTLEQIKCCEILKWRESYRSREDIGWERAWKLWQEKYAGRFAEVYNEGMKSRELYEIVTGDKDG